MSHTEELDAVHNRLMSMIEILDGQDVVVAGSAAMVLHGIELGRIPGDIDLFMPTADWFSVFHYYPYDLKLFTPERDDERRLVDPPFLIEESVPGFPVHLFFGWRYRPNEGNWDVADMLRNSVPKNGWYVAPLDVIYKQKSQAMRPKDLRDMALILEHKATNL